MSNEEQQRDETPQETSKKGYGSRWKRLLLIYLVVAVILYGIIYFFFIKNGSGGFGY